MKTARGGFSFCNHNKLLLLPESFSRKSNMESVANRSVVAHLWFAFICDQVGWIDFHPIVNN